MQKMRQKVKDYLKRSCELQHRSTRLLYGKAVTSVWFDRGMKTGRGYSDVPLHTGTANQTLHFADANADGLLLYRGVYVGKVSLGVESTGIEVLWMKEHLMLGNLFLLGGRVGFAVIPDGSVVRSDHGAIGPMK